MCLFKKKKEKKVNPWHTKGITDMELDNLLIDLLKEFHMEGHQVGYKMSGSTLTLYSNKPGWLIGPKGKNMKRMKEVIFKEFGYLKEIEICPIQNILPTVKWTMEEIEHESDLLMQDLMNDII